MQNSGGLTLWLIVHYNSWVRKLRKTIGGLNV